MREELLTCMLETDRLILRKPTLDDVESFHRAINHPDVAGNIVGLEYPMSMDEARKWIEAYTASEHERTGYYRMMTLKESGELIGCVSISPVDWNHMNAEIGFFCAVDFHGRGYGAEAVRRMIGWGFDEHGMERIYGFCADSNVASARLMELVGMQWEGVFRHEFRKDGVFTDWNHYAIIRDKWVEEKEKPSIVLKSDRLEIRSLTIEDADDFREIYDRPDVSEVTNVHSYPFEIEDAKDFIRWALRHRRESSAYYFAIRKRDTGEFVGEVHLSWIGRHNLEGNLGFGIRPEFKRHGYALEAASEILRHAFEDLGLRRIVGVTMTVNEGSRKLLEKLGMQYEGTARQEYGKGDGYADFAHYAILKSEWEEIKM